MRVTQERWLAAIEFLTTNKEPQTLSRAEKRTLAGLLAGEFKLLTQEQARHALKQLGWTTNTSHHNDCLNGSQQEWEESVFRNANHFTVFRFGPGRLPSERRQTQVYQTFPEALVDAKPDSRALIYAVTLEGRSVCLPRTEWDKYKAIWSEDNGA